MANNFNLVPIDIQGMTQQAKFEGGFTGALAGNATYSGIASAPTSVFNQAGYYAFMDPNTNYATLQKLSNNSLYTREYYDQSTNQTFNFKPENVLTVNQSQLNGNMSASEIASLFGN